MAEYEREYICRLVKADRDGYYIPTDTEIVRCKDCFWHINIRIKNDDTPDKRYKPQYCELHRTFSEDDFFCSWAKERVQ